VIQRRLARMVAMLTLYEADLVGHEPASVLERYLSEGVDSAIMNEATADVEMVDKEALGGKAPCAELFLGIESGLLDEAGRTFARELIEGVAARDKALAEIIAAAAPDWPAAQMPKVDRNVLRIAIHEIIFGNETKPAIVIDDAVELGKCFGSDSSSRFINGVLGNVAGKVDRYRRKYATASQQSDPGES